MFIATCPPGLEDLVEAELAPWGATAIKRRVGACSFEGMNAALKACLYARVISRVLAQVGVIEARDRDSLYRHAKALKWAHWFGPEVTLKVTCSRGEGALSHSQFVALVVKDAIVDALREQTGSRPTVDLADPDVTVHVYLRRGEASLSVDLCGEPLHRRGYRRGGGEAPLKENVAAAMLLRSGFLEAAAAGKTLVDPLCGSATLLIEGIWMAQDRPPNAFREWFAHSHLRPINPAAFGALQREAQALSLEREAIAPASAFFGSDIDPGQLEVARKQVRAAGVEHLVALSCHDVATLPRPGGPAGLVVTNPPYGERIGGSTSDIYGLLGALGSTVRRWQDYSAHVLVADKAMGHALQGRAERIHTLTNGPLTCALLHIPTFGPADAVTRPAKHEMLANRLRKNLRRLAPYLKEHHIEAYRLYDADLPEYSVAIDVYGGEDGHTRAHVQEYAAPKDVPESLAQARLQTAITAVTHVLNLKPRDVALKMRRRTVRDQPYTEREARAHRGVAPAAQGPDSGGFVVREDGLRYGVDLHSYIDTGLFLDHRRVRAWVRKQAHGLRVLNLFGYTGSVSVAAAAGGAQATTTVDLSATYLRWAEENLHLNRLDGPQHRVVQADCLTWVNEAQDAPYDLVFINPPTFSNSKRMEDVFDLVEQHADLLVAAMRHVRPGGRALFTTHARRLKLDARITQDYDVREVTAQMVPKDFANAKVGFRAWLIGHPARP